MTSKEVFVLGNLVTFQEILARYEAGENAFDLTLEKWGRIRKFVENAFTLQHFRETLDGAVIKVPLCFEYKDNCSICPLHGICSRGQDGLFSKFVRALQAYCIAGDLLPKSPLLGLAEQIISELESCKTESSKKMS